VAVPHARGEALPSVLHPIRRMGAAVHPDRADAPPCGHVGPERDQLLGGWVDLARDAQIAETAHTVIGGMRPALVLGYHGNAVGVVAVGTQPGAVINRHAHVVSELRTRQALRAVLVIGRRPFSGEVDLREQWRAERSHQYQYQFHNWSPHRAEQGVGFQPAASGCFLKSVLVMNGTFKYLGS